MLVEVPPADQSGKLTAMTVKTAIDRLGMFSLLLAITSFVHLVSFPTWMDLMMGRILFAASVLLLIVPRSVTILAMFLVTSLAYWFDQLPHVPNHIFFEILVHLTLVITIVAVAIVTELKQTFATDSFGERVFNQARPVIMVELIVMYLFTVLHKLNWDFLDPTVSCAVKMHAELGNEFSFVPTSAWTHWPTIIGTLLFELAIPLLLCFRHTRRVGILVGWVFHVFLALHPHGGIYSFSSLLFTLYVLFVPDDVLQALKCHWQSLAKWSKLTAKLATIGALSTVIWLQRGIYVEGGSFSEANAVGFYGWLATAVWLGATYSWFLFACQETRGQVKSPRPHPLLWSMVVLVTLNGVSPYLGFKTESVFSMFSNLRTEGDHNNHLFMPRLAILGYQDDIVQILNSNHPRLARMVQSRDLLPWFEIKRIASQSRPGTWIQLLRNGKEMILSRDSGTRESIDAFTPHSALWEKIAVFRQIRNFDQPMSCRH